MQVDPELARLLGAAPLLLHRGVETCLVDGESALARDVGGQVDWKTESVVEPEDGVAIDHLRAAQFAHGTLEQHHAVGEGLRKALLLLLQHALGQGAPARELRIRRAHLLLEHRHQLVEERLLDAELVAVTDGAANDPAQHIATPVVGGQHAVDNEERAGADVIGDHAQRARGQHRGARQLARRADQVPEQIDVVVGMHPLHDRSDALEPHAGVDRGLRQACHLAVGAALELHEDQVPDLDVAIAFLIGRAGRAAGNLRSVVVEDLAARATRAGVAHRPEVGALAQAREALRADADVLQPDLRRLVVVAVDSAPQPRRIEPQGVDQEVPGEVNRFALEVVAEGEVAQHFEERVVAGGVADVLQIVVLAAGAHAALAGGGAQIVALLAPEEHVLELHHAGVGEQQRRIVRGHERSSRARSCGCARGRTPGRRCARPPRSCKGFCSTCLQSGSGSAPVAARI